MDSLLDALERMSQPAFWETLVRLHSQAADYRQEIDSLRSVKRFNPKFANEQIAEVEQLWQASANAAGELWKVHRQAESLIRTELPELLGGLPIVDGITISSLNPASCAAMVKESLGRYLQSKLKGNTLIQSCIADCYMALNNLLPGPVDDRLRPDKVSRLIELHAAYLRLVDSGFMNSGGDPFATQAVEYRSIVASSYARVVAELSWRAIDSVLQVCRSQGVWYDRFGRDITEDQISELRQKPSYELSKAAAVIVSQDDLSRVWELFQVEIELCEKKTTSAVTVTRTEPAKPKLLTENDRELLQAMLELKAFEDNPISNEAILEKAGWTTSGKRAYVRIIEHGYVGSKRGVGYFLTTAGAKKAEQVSERT